MRYLLWGAAAALAAVSSTAAGENAWYVSLEAGMSDTSASGGFAYTPPGGILALPFYESFGGSLDESITALGSVGTHLTDDFRLEIEAGRRSGDAWQAQIAQTTLMLNAAYDIPVLDCLAVTVGVGAGIDFMSIETPEVDANGTSVAYQAMIGLSYELTKSTDITLTYRYFDTLEVDVLEVAGPDSYAALSSLDERTLSLGLRFGF